MNWLMRLFGGPPLSDVPEFETMEEKRQRALALKYAEEQTVENLARLRRMGYEVDVTLRRVGKQDDHAAH